MVICIKVKLILVAAMVNLSVGGDVAQAFHDSLGAILLPTTILLGEDCECHPVRSLLISNRDYHWEAVIISHVISGIPLLLQL